MPVTYKEPELIPDAHGEIERHPAYGQVSVFRGQSTGTVLYGSDFLHQHVISLQINESEVRRDISHDWPHQRKQLIRINLSEAQWAELIGSLGTGGGVQCTLVDFDGETLPQIPKPKDREEQYTSEVASRLTKAKTKISDTIGKIDTMKISEKAKSELRSLLQGASQELEANMEYVAKCFGEHMEKTVIRAKAEINAHISMSVKFKGELSEGTVPLKFLEDSSGK